MNKFGRKNYYSYYTMAVSPDKHCHQVLLHYIIKIFV